MIESASPAKHVWNKDNNGAVAADSNTEEQSPPRMAHNNKSDGVMAIFVEYLARPVPARGRARLVAATPGTQGQQDLSGMLASLGLHDYEGLAGPAGHAYVAITPTDVVRAMHAGAIPVERKQIEALLKFGRVPSETHDHAPLNAYSPAAASPG